MFKLRMESGQGLTLIVFLITAIIMVVMLGFLVYMAGTISDTVEQQIVNHPSGWLSPDSSYNITNIYEGTVGKLPTAYSSLPWISVMLLMGLMIASIVSAYFVPQHPVMLFPYMLFWIVAIIMSTTVSNAYETALSNDVLGPSLQTFTGANFIMANLPIWITVLGFLVGALAFGGYLYSNRTGGIV